MEITNMFWLFLSLWSRNQNIYTWEIIVICYPIPIPPPDPPADTSIYIWRKQEQINKIKCLIKFLLTTSILYLSALMVAFFIKLSQASILEKLRFHLVNMQLNSLSWTPCEKCSLKWDTHPLKWESLKTCLLFFWFDFQYVVHKKKNSRKRSKSSSMRARLANRDKRPDPRQDLST